MKFEDRSNGESSLFIASVVPTDQSHCHDVTSCSIFRHFSVYKEAFAITICADGRPTPMH